MKHALYASIQALQAYRRASWNQRVNIMTQYFERDLEIVIEEMKKKLEEDEK